MAHVPNKAQDILGDKLRAAISFKAHDNYSIDGDGLNKLQCLVARLEIDTRMDRDEALEWANLLKGMVTESRQTGVLD